MGLHSGGESIREQAADLPAASKRDLENRARSGEDRPPHSDVREPRGKKDKQRRREDKGGIEEDASGTPSLVTWHFLCADRVDKPEVALGRACSPRRLHLVFFLPYTIVTVVTSKY